MYSHSGRYVIALIGEIYNFQEIAKELGVPLKTTSDTEVVLEAFEKWGTSFVNRLNGMFAIAIYDKKEKQLFLFRDRMGIKPLLYYWDGKNLAFASELKVMEFDKIRTQRHVNKVAINEFLYLGYIPQPHTIWQKIQKFPSGYYAVVKGNSLKIQPYWKPEDQIKNEVITDFDEAKKELKELITKSIQYRLISDVPYGTFLSGGVDSSLVTAVAQQVCDTQLKTFSIGFKEAKFNESHYAKQVADHLKTDHHEFVVSHKDAMHLIEEILGTYDEPYSDPSSVPTMIVSKLARQHVTMTLSGDGGDELFHGYGAYTWANRLDKASMKMLRKPLGWGLSKMSPRYERASWLFKYPSAKTKVSHIFSQEQYYFSQQELHSLLTPGYLQNIRVDEKYNGNVRKLTPAEEQAFFDLRYYLKDDLLIKVDRASMKFALEDRVPLLDHNIVEFALNVSPELKIKNGVQKHLLKEVLYDYLPREFFDRPKWGFGIPLDTWLAGDLKYLIDDHLSEQNIKRFGVVNYEPVAELKKQYFGGKPFLYNRLWQLIVLHKWLEGIS